MGFNSTARGVWTFNRTLADEVQGLDFVLLAPTYNTFRLFDLANSRTVTRSGLVFESGKPLDVSLLQGFRPGSDYLMSIGFWWTSSALGQIRHITTKQLSSKFAPIVAKADTAVVSGIETVTAGQGEFIVNEIGVSETQNAIRMLVFGDNTDLSHIIESEPYTPGLHHVFVSILNTGSDPALLRIDIDGKVGNIAYGPTSLSSTSASFRVNDSGFGHVAHKQTQVGAILGDLTVRATDVFSSSGKQDAVTMMRFGWQHLTQSDLFNLNYTFNGLSYTQPSTVTTNQIFSEGGNIFVARSNGELLKGFQPIWDTEFDFTAELGVDGKQFNGDSVRI